MLTGTRRAGRDRRGAVRRWIALTVCLAVLFTGMVHIGHVQAMQPAAAASHHLDGDAPSQHPGADHGFGKYCPTGMSHDFYLPPAATLGSAMETTADLSAADSHGGGISAPPQIGPPRASVRI